MRTVVFLIALAVAAACSSSSAPKAPQILASVKILSGASQQATVGTALPSPIVVQALDSTGHPIAGLGVAFGQSSGSVNPASVTTDNAGKASTVWTLGPTAGPDTLLIAVGSTTILFDTVYATTNP